RSSDLGCQFAAYGQRDANTAYHWPAESLVDHAYMDLPEITKAQADAVKDFAITFFEQRGLERRSPAGGTDSGYTHAYDLTPDMVFDVHDMGEMSVAEIGEALRLAPEGEVLRCKVDALRPTTGSWAGMISLVDGDVCISDHGTYTSHFPEGSDATAALEKLGALLAERFPQIGIEPEPIVDFTMDAARPLDENLAVALQRYAWVMNDGLVCDLGAGFMTHKFRDFQHGMGPFREVKRGPRGGEEVSRLSDLWLDDPTRITVNTMQMRPDQIRPIFFEDGHRHINTYLPKEHDAAGGDATTGLEMLRNLLPIEAERTFFMQWLAYKLANPHVPGPAIIMVARDSYGTGRGSLIALMTDIFGDSYVTPIDFATLTGQGHQSQYNEWMVDSLIVAVDEAQEVSQHVNRWQARTNAYEHLKGVVDPSGRGIHIKRKTVKNFKGHTYASIFIATNHSDALVIPPNDRRFAVLENGAPLSGEYWTHFHAWRASRANVAAFVAELHKVDLTGYNPYVAPPMTASKADMIDAGLSDIDRAADLVMATLPGALLTREQFLLRMEDTIIAEGYEFPEDWHRAAERIYLRKTRRMIGKDRIRIDGKPRVVRMAKQLSVDIVQDEAAVINEVMRNGPLARPIRSSGSVVAFPSR
ncbi:MAG: primase-helicase family protein, partial [Hyphomicrobium sp.]